MLITWALTEARRAFSNAYSAGFANRSAHGLFEHEADDLMDAIGRIVAPPVALRAEVERLRGELAEAAQVVDDHWAHGWALQKWSTCCTTPTRRKEQSDE